MSTRTGKCTNTVCMSTVLYIILVKGVQHLLKGVCTDSVRTYCDHDFLGLYCICVHGVSVVCPMHIPFTYTFNPQCSQYPLLSPLSRIFKRVPTDTQPIRVTSPMRRNRRKTFQLMWSCPANLVSSHGQLCFGSLQLLHSKIYIQFTPSVCVLLILLLSCACLYAPSSLPPLLLQRVCMALSLHLCTASSCGTCNLTQMY